MYVDDEYVYWALYKPTGEHECGQAWLVRAGKSSPPLTGKPEVIAAESGFGEDPGGAADIQGGYLYYAANRCRGTNYVRRFPINASAPAVTTIATVDAGFTMLAPGGEAVYVIAFSPPNLEDVESLLWQAGM